MIPVEKNQNRGSGGRHEEETEIRERIRMELASTVERAHGFDAACLRPGASAIQRRKIHVRRRVVDSPVAMIRIKDGVDHTNS